jgi:hypothetical protein
MTCPFEHIPVLYLMTVVLRAIQLFSFSGEIQRIHFLIDIMSITQVAHLAFSLSINIYATSIIALKAWCVHVDGILEKIR